MEKFTSVEYLRALCMLYIVGFWHLFDYTAVPVGHESVAMQTITHIVLALFVFVSGYFLGGKRNKSLSAIQFYKKRLARIYPLYALAVLVFYVCGINDGWVSLKALLGISMVIQPAPLTLWFVTMLLLFYLLTPALLALVDKLALFVGAVAGIIMLTLILQFSFSSMDMRFTSYFPTFCLGIYCANRGVGDKLINLRTAMAGVVVGLLLVFVRFDSDMLMEIKDMPLLAFSAYLIFNLCIMNEHKFRERSIISFLSYAGFSMYLFHRPMYAALTSFYLPGNEILQVVYLMTVCLFIIALVSWSLQKLYDLSDAAARARLQLPGAVDYKV